jgi:CRP-like cAMP-binding protein
LTGFTHGLGITTCSTTLASERYIAMNDFAEKERRLENAIGNNNTEEALQILFELAEAFAREKNFKKAEYYRDKFYDIDPSALTQIVRINEIIEEEKSEGVDPHHRRLFADLYDRLTTEEGNALFYILKEIKVPANKTVFNQGDTSHSLFFVNQGKLRVENRHQGQSILIKSVVPGTFFGSNSFFSSSVCTSTVIAVTNSTLHRLDKDTFRQLKEEYPGVEVKFKDYCSQAGTISSHVQEKNMERRNKKRIKMAGKATIQFLTNTNALIGTPVQIGIHDISSGGTSFFLRVSNEDKTDFMVGRKLVIQFSLKTETPPVNIQKKGSIVAICPNPFNNFSFHMKFDSPLRLMDLDSLLLAFSKNRKKSDKN